MTAIAADLHPACSDLLPDAGIQVYQRVAPDPIPSRACARARDAATDTIEDAPRDANGRFAKGHSGNPRGRPRGIPNPRRRPLGLLLRQARPGTLVPLVRRKRYLLRPVLSLVLPPARRPDPGERLGIDFARMRSASDIVAAMSKIFAAIGRGEITPSEGLCLMRRSRKPLRAIRRRLWRDLARLGALRRGKRSSRVRELVGSSPARGGGGAPHGPRGAPEGGRNRNHAPSTMLRMVPLPLAGEEPRRSRRSMQLRCAALRACA